MLGVGGGGGGGGGILNIKVQYNTTIISNASTKEAPHPQIVVPSTTISHLLIGCSHAGGKGGGGRALNTLKWQPHFTKCAKKPIKMNTNGHIKTHINGIYNNMGEWQAKQASPSCGLHTTTHMETSYSAYKCLQPPTIFFKGP